MRRVESITPLFGHQRIGAAAPVSKRCLPDTVVPVRLSTALANLRLILGLRRTPHGGMMNQREPEADKPAQQGWTPK